jgi:hypothetical protein
VICFIERHSPYRKVNTPRLGYKNRQLVQYREIIAICSEIHTKQIALCGQNLEFVNVKMAVRILTTGFRGLNLGYKNHSVNVV